MPSQPPIGMDRYFNFREKLCLTVINGFSVFMTVFLTQMITTVFPAYPSVMVEPHNESTVAFDVALGNCSVSDPDNIYVSILIGAKYCIEIVMFPIAGWISDKYHPPLVLLCGALVESLVCVVYSVSGNFYMSIFARCLDAIGYAVVATSGLTIVYCMFGSERARNKVITIDSVSLYVAASVSPYVAGTIYEHFSRYGHHASRVATFMWILPLFLLLVVLTVPFAFPGSWVSRLVLRGPRPELAGHCSRRSSAADPGKPLGECGGGSNGQCMHNKMIGPLEVLHKPSGTQLTGQLPDETCVSRAHTQLDTEQMCVSLARQDQDCVPLVSTDTNEAPLTHTQLDTECARQNQVCVSLVHTDTEGASQTHTVPDTDQECVPLVPANTEGAHLTHTQLDTECTRQDRECVSLVPADTEGASQTHTQMSTECVACPDERREPSLCAVASVVQPVSMLRLLRDPHVMVALCALLCNGLTNNSLETTLPIFMIRKFCATQQQQGAVFLFGFLSLVGFSGSSLLFHRHPAISWGLPVLGLLVSGGLCIALAFCRPWWTIGLCIGLLSFASAITEVILIPLIAKIIDVKYAVSYGSASGLTMLTFTISGLIGTFPVGALVQRCGFLTLCVLLCVINCACAPFIVVLRRFFS